jgi:transcription elongation GreA/GreB family factor
MPAMTNLKKELHQLCIKYVRKRMDEAEQAIKEAQQASNDDTKSSAGDKYETGRAMMQQETNRNLTQLNEANKLMVALQQIGTNGTVDKVEQGSLVVTNYGKFYIAISAGTLDVDGETFYAISQASPVGMKLKTLKTGDHFELNGKEFLIEQIL